MGIPIYSERGPHGGFSLVRGYKMPPLIFTPDEATALYLGASLVEEMWGELYAAPAQGALAKLDNVLPEQHRQEIAQARQTLVVTGMHRLSYSALKAQLEPLRRAVREQRRVRLVYQGRAAEELTSREPDPYAIVQRWGWWYTIGFCHLRQALRWFRLDRIVSLELLPDVFVRPPDFDVTMQMSEAEPQPAVHVRMRFLPPAAALARYNRGYWASLAEETDGAVVVTFTAADQEWATSTVLAYGPLVEVLEPAAVRQLVAEWAAAVVARYADR